MRYSIGRGSKVKKSTGMNWEELKQYQRKNRRYGTIRYSTGRESPIEHFTGTLTGKETDEEPDLPRQTWQWRVRELQKKVRAAKAEEANRSAQENFPQ